MYVWKPGSNKCITEDGSEVPLLTMYTGKSLD